RPCRRSLLVLDRRNLGAALRAHFLGAANLMTTAQPASEAEPRRRSTFAEWFGVLAGPIAWAMQLQANYALVLKACADGSKLWLYVSSAVFLLVALSALFVSRRVVA